VTKSAESAEPRSARRSVDWWVKSNSSSRLQERELGAARQARKPRLLTVRDLFGDEEGEEVMEGPLLALGAHDELAPEAPGIGEVQALEEAIDVDGGGFHSASSRCGPALGRSPCSAWAMYSAPKRRPARPRSKAPRSVSAPWFCRSSCN